MNSLSISATLMLPLAPVELPALAPAVLLGPPALEPPALAEPAELELLHAASARAAAPTPAAQASMRERRIAGDGLAPLTIG
ncbi:MAG: hypothetical protein ACRDNS_11305, partial [Trebonia sp.]